jgi:hypothetical protein
MAISQLECYVQKSQGQSRGRAAPNLFVIFPIQTNCFSAGFWHRHVNRGYDAVILFESLLRVGNTDRIGRPSTTHAEVFARCGIPSNDGVLHCDSDFL